MDNRIIDKSNTVVGEVLSASKDPSLKTNPIESILNEEHYSLKDLVQCGIEGLKATKSIRDAYGEVHDDMPDYNIRHKYFESFMSLLGHMKANSVNVQVVQISKEERDLLEAYKRS